MPAESSTRPLLLPQNRKLRHLRGVYLRNLSFGRPRGQTIDDTALNKSPGKLETLRETPQLHHAASSESLRLSPKVRRRSTNLANASPVTRQKKLEYAVDSRVADAFFSLHCEGENGPIYVSEVEERATVGYRSLSWATDAILLTRRLTEPELQFSVLRAVAARSDHDSVISIHGQSLDEATPVMEPAGRGGN